MSLSLIFGCLWVLASAAVALMPMKYQYVPGVTLLLLAPLLLIWIGREHGVWLALLALAAAASMFRRPLIYFGRKALGLEDRGGET